MTLWPPRAALALLGAALLIDGVVRLDLPATAAIIAALVLLIGGGAVGIAMFLRAILTLPLDEKDER